jgi:predicted aldo/keto reductase-like oxidoreductase
VSHYQIYKDLHCFEWLREKKAQGLVKHIGFSFHDTAEVLDQILTEQPDMEFVQLQINYLDWESESVQSRKCYEVARKHNIPIIVMEPVKGGTLANVPPAVRGLFKSNHPDMSVPSWAIRFAAGLPGVMMVLSGMSNMEQLLDNISYMQEFEPLTFDEQKLVHRAADLIRCEIAIPCTGCAYCVDGCPMNIAIPQYFALYNAAKASAGDAGIKQEYRKLTEKFGRASECIGCGQCEGVCPQQLPIIAHLATVAKEFE